MSIRDLVRFPERAWKNDEWENVMRQAPSVLIIYYMASNTHPNRIELVLFDNI